MYKLEVVEVEIMKKTNAVVLAILAALFYAISIPVSKVLLRYTAPTMLAAFLYIGAGIGIGIIYFAKQNVKSKRKKLNREDLPYTIGMIVLDIIAPILLMNGISRTAAANVSLLNNFEIVATAVIAFVIFKEKISLHMWIALGLITLSSMVLSFEGIESFNFSIGSVMVIAATICWGFENNCTRKISAKDTYEIVTLKGICSGTGSLLIAVLIGERLPMPIITLMILLLGFVAYGLSIFTYVRAQEVIGAAKTSAFYALSPFIGALLSFLILHEKLSDGYLTGLIIMIVGSILAIDDTMRYRHNHVHSHIIHHLYHGKIVSERITHEHAHSHMGFGFVHFHAH